ncbi:MAG: S41 family peptidase [Fervidobacterium sp.]|nr:S41 family peptidase [Fervidobacterium sp.]
MKIGVRLFVLFVLSGIVVTFLLSWIIEFYKYQERLVSKQELQTISNYLVKVVNEMYPSKFSTEKLKEFQSALETIQSTKKMKFLPIEAFALIQPALNVLKDQNLRLFVPNEPVYSVLPFSVRVLDKKVIVTSTATEKIPCGAQVLSINNITVDDLIDELLRFTSGETYEISEQQLGQLIQLAPELLWKKRRFVWIFYNQEDYDVKYIIDGKTRTEKIKTVTLFSYPVLSSKYQALPSEAPYHFEREGDIGVLKIRTFSLSGTVYNKFREFLDNLFVYNKDVKKIIIDVRGSSVRDFTVFKEVFEHFIDKKIAVLRNVSLINTAYILRTLEKYGIEYKKSTGEVLTTKYSYEFKPREPYSSAQIWVLFDKYTSHAALDFVYIFKKLYPGRTIGEKTIGLINHTTDVVYQYFDNIRTSLSYPTAKFSDEDGENPITADIELNISTQDRLNQLFGLEDIVLKRVIEIVQKR